MNESNEVAKEELMPRPGQANHTTTMYAGVVSGLVLVSALAVFLGVYIKRRSGSFVQQQGDIDIVQHVRIVALEDGRNGEFGFTLTTDGHDPSLPHYITKIYPGTPAAKSGNIRLGDQLLAVNETRVTGEEHEWVLDLIGRQESPVFFKLVTRYGRTKNGGVLHTIMPTFSKRLKRREDGSTVDERPDIEISIGASQVHYVVKEGKAMVDRRPNDGISGYMRRESVHPNYETWLNETRTEDI